MLACMIIWACTIHLLKKISAMYIHTHNVELFCLSQQPLVCALEDYQQLYLIPSRTILEVEYLVMFYEGCKGYKLRTGHKVLHI